MRFYIYKDSIFILVEYFKGAVFSFLFIFFTSSLFFEPNEFYLESKDLENEPKGGIAVIRGWTATKVDAENKKVTLDDGTEIEYDKCLIATGIRPKDLPVFEKSKDVRKKVLFEKSYFFA